MGQIMTIINFYQLYIKTIFFYTYIFIFQFAQDDKLKDVKYFKELLSLNPESDVIVYESEREEKDEYTKFKREYDPTITIPLDQRDLVIRNSKENRKI